MESGKTILLFAVLCCTPMHAADPAAPVFWSAKQMQDIDRQAVSKLNLSVGLGSQRLLDSAFVLYREGPSQAEIHTQQADFIVFREGEGAILAGGKIAEAKPSGPGELRGKSISGGTKYPFKAGDTMYIPANMPHQFLVEPGKHFTATIVKITPKK